MFKWFRLGLCCALLFLATRSHADAPTPTQVASDAYERGMARFRLDEYEGAINEWEDGFRVKPASQFLYNIAQAYRAWKRPDKAIVFYRKYLAMDPKTPNRPTVEHTIAMLEKQVQENPAPPEPAISGPVVTAPPPAAPIVEATPAPMRTTEIVAAPPPRKPVTKRAWFWGVVGTGIVVVAGAVVVGVVLGTRSSGPRTIPSVTF